MFRSMALVVCLGTFALTAAPRAASAQTFSNSTAIMIPGSGSGGLQGAPAAPYPSRIAVTGLSAPIGRVSITLHGLSHTRPDDIDVLLVAPDGAKLVVFSDIGSDVGVTNLTVTISDQALSRPPQVGPLTSGTFHPFNY